MANVRSSQCKVRSGGLSNGALRRVGHRHAHRLNRGVEEMNWGEVGGIAFLGLMGFVVLAGLLWFFVIRHIDLSK